MLVVACLMVMISVASFASEVMQPSTHAKADNLCRTYAENQCWAGEYNYAYWDCVAAEKIFCCEGQCYGCYPIYCFQSCMFDQDFSQYCW